MNSFVYIFVRVEVHLKCILNTYHFLCTEINASLNPSVYHYIYMELFPTAQFYSKVIYKCSNESSTAFTCNF